MDDGSKSTDEKNAHLFKEKKSKKDSKEKDESEEEALVLRPKNAQSAYSFFSSEFMKSHKDDAEAKDQGLMSYTASKWALMSDQDKVKYVKMHEADVVRNERQKKELAEKGYFKLENGSKSTDEQNIPKQKKVKKLIKKLEESKVEEKPMKKKIVDKK